MAVLPLFMRNCRFDDALRVINNRQQGIRLTGDDEFDASLHHPGTEALPRPPP